MTQIEQKLANALEAEQNAREAEQTALHEELQAVQAELKAIQTQNDAILKALQKDSDSDSLSELLDTWGQKLLESLSLLFLKQKEK